ncbi:hypothetical protein B0T10DRAFT_325096 [Thelonectria olida]|uniref:Peptidase S8/S53 domain-containing protein n=1 Tax=Thelonectria olida TaxID=1576542 RepID=A0A9P9AR87_9HYPO|nr:hypothetical protein B0T10DRAFT_325096 [Thelonectria olida]
MESPKDLLKRLDNVLPTFLDALSSTGRDDADWEFKTPLRSEFRLLQNVLQKLPDHFGNRKLRFEKECTNALRELLQCLDNLADEDARSEYAVRSFPGLEAIRRSTPQKLSQHLKRKHPKLNVEIKEWTTRLRDIIPGSSGRQRPSYNVHEFAASLHHVLQGSLEKSKCSCPSSHEALLFMANHLSFSEAKDSDITFDVLITGTPPSMSRRWFDTEIKVPVSSDVKDRSSGGDEARRVKFSGRPTCEPVTICSYIARFNRGYMSDLRGALVADGSGLRQDRPRKRARFDSQQLSSARPISFRDFLNALASSPNGPPLSLQVLTRLAILVATSFLHHYGGPWIPRTLDKDQFQLITTKSGTLLIPFLPFVPSAVSAKHERPKADIDGQLLPRLDCESSLGARVDLGILLLELFQQKPLDIGPARHDFEVSNSLFMEVYFEVQEHLEPYREVSDYEFIINSIDGILDIAGTSASGDSEECELFYQHVIMPLEESLIKLCGTSSRAEDLDVFVFQGNKAQLNTDQTPVNTSGASQLDSNAEAGNDEQEIHPSSNGIDAPTRDPTAMTKKQQDTVASDHLDSSSPEPSNSEDSLLESFQNSNMASQLYAPGNLLEDKARDRGRISIRKKKVKSQSERYMEYLNFLQKEASSTWPSDKYTRDKAISALKWLQEFIKIDDDVFVPLTEQKTLPRKVKIAVLDTGCDLNTEFFDEMHNEADKQRIMGAQWKDFIDDEKSPKPVDVDGHGTKITTALLMLLPRAEIFIGRVARTKEEFNAPGVEEAISKAIRHAAEKWAVDVITLSFGFLDTPESIEHAIEDALGRDMRNRRLLIFAAANNQGRNESERFPASSRHLTISARGTNHNGGFEARYNPKGDGVLYGTLAVEVPCTHKWIKDEKRSEVLTMSGCSIAAPIMAAIAATYLQYALWKLGCLSEGDPHVPHLERLFEADGMLALFEMLTRKDGDRRYLNPWQLFREKDQASWESLLVTAAGELKKRRPAVKSALKKES